MACSCSRICLSGASPSAPSLLSEATTTSSLSLSKQYLPSGSKSCKLLAPLRWSSDKNTKQAQPLTSVASATKHGQADKSNRANQRGGSSRGGRPHGNAGSTLGSKDSGKGSSVRNGGKNYIPRNSDSTRQLPLLSEEDDEDDNNEDDDDEEEEDRRRPRSYNTRSRSYSSNGRTRTGSTLSAFSDEEDEDDGEDDDSIAEGKTADEDVATADPLMPIPPAGFILSDDGSVSIMASPDKRITTIMDPENNLSLDCLIRRVLSSSDGRQCFVLCPLDTPVQILRIEGETDVLKEITDKELEDVFPTASYELAKRRLHLVYSGFCLTLRGSFCFSEDEVIDLNTEYTESESGQSLNEGVEVASFEYKGSEYLIFTPLDPLMFVAYKDSKTGELAIADDDLLADEAVLDAIDEEKEFQAYMEEEELLVMDDDDDEKGEDEPETD